MSWKSHWLRIHSKNFYTIRYTKHQIQSWFLSPTLYTWKKILGTYKVPGAIGEAVQIVVNFQIMTKAATGEEWIKPEDLVKNLRSIRTTIWSNHVTAISIFLFCCRKIPLSPLVDNISPAIVSNALASSDQIRLELRFPKRMQNEGKKVILLVKKTW